MIPETPIPVKEAIRIAPVDPMATGGQVTLYARQEIDRWRTEDENFQLSFDNLTESINPGEKDAFILYLASMAITLQNYSRSPVDNQNENLRRTAEGQIGRTLFNMLSKPDVQTEIQAVNKTWHAYNKSHRFRPESDNGHNIETKSPVPSEKEQDLLPLGRWLLKRLFAFEQKLITEKRPPEIREYIGILEEALSICRENGIKRPPLYNLIIGNIDLTGELEPEYADVAERMGQDGLKWHRIMDRANAYEEMIKRAQENYTGYQALGLGWRGLRDRHEQYLARYGLTGYIHEGKLDGTFISYAATDAFLRSYLLSRLVLRKEIKDERFHPRLLFPTPGFTMLAKLAENGLEMETIEYVTQAEENFFFNPGKLKEFLQQPENDDVLIIDLQFINNPGSKIVPAEQFKKVIDVIADHQGRKGAKIIIVNDGAYLGMAYPDNQDKIKTLGEILNGYNRRIDILPMTKIYGQPGLRDGFGGTPDRFLAAHVPAITKLICPTVSYPLMFRALAIGDFVKPEDQAVYFEMLSTRQEKLLDVLRRTRPDIFDIDRSFIAPDQPGEKGAFYLFVPIRKGINPLYIPVMTGLFGNLDDTFYLHDRTKEDIPPQRYLRLALGIESFSDEKLEKLEKDLIIWRELYQQILKPVVGKRKQ